MSADAPLRHPLLEACGVSHGFGVRGSGEPAGCRRPQQVHGTSVALPGPDGTLKPQKADAVVSNRPGLSVAIVTADCVPILAASRDGAAVAAIHAGWRGLAAGVVSSGIDALRQHAAGEELVAVLGPAIGVCCYEVDTPVWQALEARPELGAEVARHLRPARPGHARIDLPGLAREALARAGLDPDAVSELPDVCTRCDGGRFHSYRRDGARAGRLVHTIAARVTGQA